MPDELTVGGVFDGVGLLAYGLHLAGLQHRWLCEVDPWRRTILEQRFPGCLVHPDVRRVGAATCEPVDIIAGGFPCKGASTAGKRNGFDHPETVLWREMARAVGELRPRYVLVENVANILALHDGAVWGEVLGDLAALGYDTTWDCVPAGAVGAPHLRDRVFAVAAHTDGPSEQRDPGIRGQQDGRPHAGGGREDAPDALLSGLEGPGIRGAASDHAGPAADAGGDGLRPQPQPKRRRSDSAVAACAGEAAADAHGGRGEAGSEQDQRSAGGQRAPFRHDSHGRGVRVEWGEYEPAIRRWEAIAGPAPEPLVRRVDDRSAARVERSRLAALGDGVQVQVGQLAGAYIRDLERGRMTPQPGTCSACGADAVAGEGSWHHLDEPCPSWRIAEFVPGNSVASHNFDRPQTGERT